MMLVDNLNLSQKYERSHSLTVLNEAEGNLLITIGLLIVDDQTTDNLIDLR